MFAIDMNQLYRFSSLARESRFVIEMFGKCRRFLHVHLKPDYVEKQLNRRRGTCKQCGVCCALLLTCPMLSRDGLCLVYGRTRPKVCTVFPIDQRDIDEIACCGGSCGYHFEAHPQQRADRPETSNILSHEPIRPAKRPASRHGCDQG